MKRWNRWVHSKEFRGRLSFRVEVQTVEGSGEVISGGKGWQPALNSWTVSCTQTKNPNPPLPHAPREQWSWGSSVSAHQGCAFRRWGRCSLVSHPRLRTVLQGKPCKHYPMSNKRRFCLLKHSHFPAISLVPPSSNMSWSSPFPMHFYFLSIIFQRLEVFCGSLLMGVVSWMSSHCSCLLGFSTKISSCSHSTHISSLCFPLGRQVWPWLAPLSQASLLVYIKVANYWGGQLIELHLCPVWCIKLNS